MYIWFLLGILINLTIHSWNINPKTSKVIGWELNLTVSCCFRHLPLVGSSSSVSTKSTRIYIRWTNRRNTCLMYTIHICRIDTLICPSTLCLMVFLMIFFFFSFLPHNPKHLMHSFNVHTISTYINRRQGRISSTIVDKRPIYFLHAIFVLQ